MLASETVPSDLGTVTTQTTVTQVIILPEQTIPLNETRDLLIEARNTDGSLVGPGDAGAQAVYILDKIAAAIEALGGSIDDVVQTRIWLRDANDWEAVGRVHGRVFAEARPANTLVEVARLVGNYLVEIEAEAIVG